MVNLHVRFQSEFPYTLRFSSSWVDLCTVLWNATSPLSKLHLHDWFCGAI